MNLYDIISEIAQKQCEKLYEVKISIGKTLLNQRVVVINNLEIDFENVVFSDTVCKKLEDGLDIIFVCIQTQNCIFILDKIGEI